LTDLDLQVTTVPVYGRPQRKGKAQAAATDVAEQDAIEEQIEELVFRMTMQEDLGVKVAPTAKSISPEIIQEITLLVQEISIETSNSATDHIFNTSMYSCYTDEN
jgi:hypothetical protein